MRPNGGVRAFVIRHSSFVIHHNMSSLAPAVVEKAASPQENVVLPALRGDLAISKQYFEGRTYYVVKDPISLQYFRLTAEDYALATLFNGGRTFGQIRDEWAKGHPHLRLDFTSEELNERVLKFANDLALLQFLSVQGQRVKARLDAKKLQKKSRRFVRLGRYALSV